MTTDPVNTYGRWHHLQVMTSDLDPVYPVLASLIADEGLSKDSAAWLVLAHVAFYDAGSAQAAWRLTDGDLANLGPRLDQVMTITRTGVERRGNRDPAQRRKHLVGLARIGGQPWAWLGQDGWDWPVLNHHLMSLPGNGRWAAYKAAEMCQKVLGAPTRATDAGHAYSSGPRKGLDLLVNGLPTGNTPDAVRYLDAITDWLAERIGEEDIAQVETSLCDFHSLARGNYYLGHDIDAHLAQVLRAEAPDRKPLMKARLAALPQDYLGECHGWNGPDRLRKAHFALTGEILTRGDA